MTPEAITLRTNTSPYAARLRTPSWMRAPPESLSPISGMPLCSARSWMRQIFCDCTSENEPPSTVKSCAKTATRRPLILPKPVTMPSPGKRCLSRPNSDDVVRGERAELLERAFVEQQREPLARGELAARVLLLDALLPAAQHRAAAHLAQHGQVFVRRPLRHRRLPVPS